MIHDTCPSPHLEGTEEAVRWNDLQINATVLPQYEAIALKFIEEGLGYLPHLSIRLPLEPYLRGLLNSYQLGLLVGDAFNQAVDDHLKLIRNADMAIYQTEPTAYFKTMYQDLYERFGLLARQRLARFLGYEPRLEYSLMAELWLWDIMARVGKLPDSPTAVDFKALTIIRYREILLKEGKQAADVSSLCKPY